MINDFQIISRKLLRPRPRHGIIALIPLTAAGFNLNPQSTIHNPQSAMPQPLRHPIVLVHGLGGFDRLGFSRLHIDYFRRVAGWLVAAGAPRVYAAALPPNGSIARRAAALSAFIEREVAEPAFHLLAHSMGGLDSRYYLSCLGGAARGACSLTTLGTPHRGSPLATLALDSLFNPCFRMARRLHWGRAVRFGLSQTAAHRDLRPAACEAFNRAVPDVPGVAYFSWAGSPPPEAVQGPLRIGWSLLRRSGEGENDGLVAVESARWTGWRGVVPADHLSLVGWQLTPEARRCFSARDFYARLVEDLQTLD